MTRDRFDRWCEWGILGLVLVILVLGPLAMGAVGAVPFAIIQVLTAGVLLLWGVRLWIDIRPKLLWPPICWGVLAFVLYAVGRYLTADVEYIARQELLRVVVYAFLFLAILNNLHRQEWMSVLVFTLIFLAMAIAGYATYQFVTGSDQVWHVLKPYAKRGSGTYICPNHLGGFLEMLLPLGFAYTLVGRLKPVTRILIGYASLVITVGIVVTVSRGAWLSTAVALVGLFGVLAMQRRYRLPALVAVGVLVLAGLYFMPRNLVFQKRVRDLVTADNRVSDGLRFALWQPAYRMWQDNPVWGVGPNHFDVRFGGYRPDRVQIRPDRVHNDYLNTMADWGSAGALLVIGSWVLLGITLPGIWRTVRVGNADFSRKAGSNKMALVAGASAGMVAILVHSVVDFNMHIPANAILLITLMALVASHVRFATERYWISADVLIRSVLTLVLLPGIVVLVATGSRRISEQRWLQRAEAAEVFSANRLGCLKSAFEVEPRNPRTAFEIGESLRRLSTEGGETYESFAGGNYRTLAEEAMVWYGKASALNPWHAASWAGHGWCLDWLKRHDESPPFFERALLTEPNSYWIMNFLGIHYVEVGNYAAARSVFERSRRLETARNDIAQAYLGIVNARLLDFAAGSLEARLKGEGQTKP